MPAPRVLVCVSTLGASGAVHYVDRILPMLSEAFGYVALAALPNSWILHRWQDKIPCFASRFERFPLHTLNACLRFCAAEKIDVVHSHMSRANNFAAMLQVLHGIPNVSHVHENKPHPRYWLPKLLIAVSGDTLKRHRRTGAGILNRSVLLYNFVDERIYKPAQTATLHPASPDALRRCIGVDAHVPVIVHIGEICRRKGQDITLQAMPDIWQAVPDAQVVFIGHGQALTTLMDPRIHWLGQRDDLPALLPHATVAVMPAREEPFGLAIVEAMASQVPVVASAVGGPLELITPGSGCLIDPQTPQTLASAVVPLLTNPQLRQTIAKAGRTRALAFSRSAHQKHLIQLLTGAARQGSGPEGN